MADTPNTISTLNGLFKVTYADKIEDLVPDFAILQKRLSFMPADKQNGNYYAQPVNLAHEQGFSYLGDAGSVSTLNDAVAGTMKEAQVKGSELILRAQISYLALSRSTSSSKAFKQASSWKVTDMNNSMRKRLEIAMLYGRVGIGTVESYSSDALVITEGSWAGGIWAGAENSRIDIYQSDLATLRLSADNIRIASVNSDTRTLTLESGHGATPVAGDVVFFYGANSSGTFNEMAGLQKIIQNSTTLFNIDAAAYSLWKGNSVTSAGELTFAKVQDYLSRAVNKGLMEKVIMLVSPKGWAKLNSDMAALRTLDDSYSAAKLENGGESIVYHSVNGQVEIVAHPFVKQGDAFILPLDSVMRVGSLDLSFSVPGFDEQFFNLVQGKNAVELQCLADQAIFIERPAHSVFVTGITYA